MGQTILQIPSSRVRISTRATDTDDVLEEIGTVKLAPLLDGGDDTGKHGLLRGPVVLEQNQKLTKCSLVLGIGKGHILASK